MAKFKINLNTYRKEGRQKGVKNAAGVEKTHGKKAKTKYVKTGPSPLLSENRVQPFQTSSCRKRTVKRLDRTISD